MMKKLAPKKIAVGVLALQGDFLEHVLALRNLGVETVEIRLLSDLENISGLIIPGGESTTIAKLMDQFKLRAGLIKKIRGGLPVWGTCAGMILLAKKLAQSSPRPLGVMDIQVNRNAFGRQRESFSVPLKIKGIIGGPLHATFIRAPQISKIGNGMEVLSRLSDGTIVAVRQKNILATAFHPELTDDIRMHQYFLGIIKQTD